MHTRTQRQNKKSAKPPVAGRAQSTLMDGKANGRFTRTAHSVDISEPAQTEAIIQPKYNLNSTTLRQDFSQIPAYPKAQYSLQAKLKINAPGDVYEQQADRLADQVMRMPEPRLQRRCACGGTCPKCRAKSGSTAAGLQAKSIRTPATNTAEVPPVVGQVLSAPGHSLDSASREFFEPRLGYDFSQVRIHTDRKAQSSAEAVNARAYTVGQNIVFGQGQYQPGTHAGRHLLAHELTHVLQQGQTINSAHPNEPRPSENTESTARSGQSNAPLDIQPAQHGPALQRQVHFSDDCYGLFGPCQPGRGSDSDRLAWQAEAITRMESTQPWATLRQGLDGLLPNGAVITRRFCAREDRCPTDGIGFCPSGGDTRGKFCPDQAGSGRYIAFTFFLGNEEISPTPRPEGSAPVATEVYGSEQIPSFVVQRPSRLAETLFHEILHIWYVNRFPARFASEIQSTGHTRTGPQGFMEREFADRLRSFATAIHRVELDPATQARAAAPATAPGTEPQPSVPSPSPTPEPSPQSSDASDDLSFITGVRASAFGVPQPGGPSPEFAGAFSAGLLYGDAYRFRAVGQMLWVPNTGLMAIGGELGVRLLQTTEDLSGRSEVAPNPLFIDFSAGIAGVIELQDGALADPQIVPLLLSVGTGVGAQFGDSDGVQGFIQADVRGHGMPSSEDGLLLGYTLGGSGGLLF